MLLTCFIMAERASLAMSGFVSPLMASTTPDVESAMSGSILGSCQQISRYHYISLRHSLIPTIKSRQRNGDGWGKIVPKSARKPPAIQHGCRGSSRWHHR